MSKKYMITFGILLMILMLLLSPDICIAAAKEGLLLWFNKILPSLLPFIILINILSQLNIMKEITSLSSPLTQKLWKLPGDSLFAFIMGFIAGYPMGAKVIKQLLEHQLLSPKEGQKLLCFSNNCGPLFIIGTVGTLMLNNTSLGYFLLLIHMLSALLLGFICSFYETTPSYSRHKRHDTRPEKSLSLAHIFNEAVANGMDTIVYIGGYIIFFSVIASIIKSSSLLIHAPSPHPIDATNASTTLSFITGLLELSNGVNMLAASPISLYVLAFISFLIGFGGICVYFQTSYVLGNCNFSLIPYLIAKFMQGLLSFILTCLFYPLFAVYTLRTTAVFEIVWVFILFAAILLFIYIVKCLNTLFFKKISGPIKKTYLYRKRDSRVT